MSDATDETPNPVSTTADPAVPLPAGDVEVEEEPPAGGHPEAHAQARHEPPDAEPETVSAFGLEAGGPESEPPAPARPAKKVRPEATQPAEVAPPAPAAPTPSEPE